MNHKQKILQYLDFKGISQGKFCRKCGFSNSFLASGEYFGTDKLTIIINNYDDLNINWLLFDKGNMLLLGENEVNEQPETYQNNTAAIELLKKELENAEKLLEAKNETIAVLKHQLGIHNNGNGHSKAS